MLFVGREVVCENGKAFSSVAGDKNAGVIGARNAIYLSLFAPRGMLVWLRLGQEAGDWIAPEICALCRVRREERRKKPSKAAALYLRA